MIVVDLALEHCHLLRPEPFHDARGSLYESFRHDQVLEATGIAFDLRQVNHTVNHRGTLRGIHLVTVPPGQAKIVTCVRGTARTVLVDLRVGSPRFGAHVVHDQVASLGEALLVPSGIGLAYLALEDDTCMSYLYTTEYDGAHIVDVDPLDPDLGLPWGLDDLDLTPVLSDRDAAAPTARQAAERGLLPSYAECVADPAGGRPA